MRRLEQLRLSSGKDRLPKVSKVTEQARNELRRDLMIDID